MPGKKFERARTRRATELSRFERITMTIHVEVFVRGHGKTSESELSEIEAWHRKLFAEDQDIIDAFTWQNKSGMGFNVQTYCDDELVGFAHVFARLARLDDSAVLTGGLGGVLTPKQHQGKGIGSTTVRKANDIILNNLRADLGVLLCKATLVSFYERLGWRRMLSPVVIEQPGGKMQWPHEAMVLLRKNEGSIPGMLDLCGLPF